MIQCSSDDMGPKCRVLRPLKYYIRDLSRHAIMSFVDSYNKFHPSDDAISGELKDSVDDKYNLELKDWQRGKMTGPSSE